MTAHEPQPCILGLLLNAHIPYVRTRRNQASDQESWLFEVILESYLPIMDTCERLRQEQVDFSLALAVSPTLLEMLADPDLQERCLIYIGQRLEYARMQANNSHNAPALQALAQRYAYRYAHSCKQYTQKYNLNLIDGLIDLSQSGHLELLASCATSAYLNTFSPLQVLDRAQIQLGIDVFRQHLKTDPQGFWLPECGYRPELDSILVDCGIKYTVVSTLSMLGATPRPSCATSLPVKTPQGLVAMCADLECHQELWSPQSGYYAAPEYRAFRPAIQPEEQNFVSPTSDHRISGLKIYRNTGPTDHKELYQTRVANKLAWFDSHAFLENRRRQNEWIARRIGRSPVILSVLNAEFLGYYWTEGTLFLEYLWRQAASLPSEYTFLTPSQILTQFGELETCQPNLGSWLDGSFNARLVNPTNDWIAKQLALAGQRMQKMANIGHQDDPGKARLINQAARELLLAQSSDWAIMMSTGQHLDYARKRLRNHLTAFHHLFDDFREGRVDEAALRKLETRNPIFADLDYTKYFKSHYHDSAERKAVNVIQPSQPLPETELPSKEAVVAEIVRLQTVTRQLVELCQSALAANAVLSSAELSHKASESVAIVERLASIANDEAALDSYIGATSTLENIINSVALATTPQELEALQQAAPEAVNKWSQTVERLLQSAMSRTNL